MSSLKQDYQKAFLSLLESGEDVDKTIKRVKVVMEKRGHSGLLLSVFKSTLRELDRTSVAKTPRLTVAREKDVRRYADGHKEAEVIIDPHLIGGYRFEQNNTMIDQSYKTKLLNWYRVAVKSN